jgi:acyl dehydratase
MAVDPEKLRHFHIAPRHQTISAHDAILYALSVGLGSDPLDTRQLDFVDHHRALKVMPAMAVVLAYPGFWLGDPATGVDAVRLVHGEQGIIWHAPMPIGAEMVGRTRVVGLADKGPGKGALLYTEKTLHLRETDALLATCTSTTFLRGDGGFGGVSDPVKPAQPAPEGTPDHIVDLPTRPEQALYYRLNGDDNPLHADPEIAAKAGFARPILHGLCTLGVVTHALLRALSDYDTNRLKALDLRFSAPVYPGETIRTEIWADGGFRARVVERDVIVVNNGKVLVS